MLVRIEPLASFIAAPLVSGSIGVTTILTWGELLNIVRRIGIEVLSPRDPATAISYATRNLEIAKSSQDYLRIYFAFSLHPRAVENYPFGSWSEAFMNIKSLIEGDDRLGLFVGVFHGNSFELVPSLFGINEPSIVADLEKIA